MISLKKLIFAPCFLSLLASCGKKIENSSSDDNSGEENQVIILPGDSGIKKLTVNYSDLNSDSDTTSLTMKGSAWVRIPAAPKVIAGNAMMIATRIRFNVQEMVSAIGENEVYCDYFSIKRTVSNGSDLDEQYDHHFKGCFEDVDNDGQADELNFIPGDEVGVLGDREVQVVISPDQNTEDLVLESEIEIDYL